MDCNGHTHRFTVDHFITEEENEFGIPIGEVFGYCGCGACIDYKEIQRRVNLMQKILQEDGWRLHGKSFMKVPVAEE